MDNGSDEWDYWIEAGKVEIYLERLGFCVREIGEEATTKRNPAVCKNGLLLERRGGSYTSTSIASDDIRVPQPAPQLPYGSKWQPNSCMTNTLFDEDGNFQVPASWLTPSMSEVVFSAEPLAAPEYQAYLNAERLVQSGVWMPFRCESLFCRYV